MGRYKRTVVFNQIRLECGFCDFHLWCYHSKAIIKHTLDLSAYICSTNTEREEHVQIKPARLQY